MSKSDDPELERLEEFKKFAKRLLIPLMDKEMERLGGHLPNVNDEKRYDLHNAVIRSLLQRINYMTLYEPQDNDSLDSPKNILNKIDAILNRFENGYYNLQCFIDIFGREEGERKRNIYLNVLLTIRSGLETFPLHWGGGYKKTRSGSLYKRDTSKSRRRRRQRKTHTKTKRYQ